MQRRILTTLAPVLLAAGTVLMIPAAATGQGSYGAFTYLEEERAQGTMENLLVPDTASTLGRGARLFFRCGLGRPEVFVAMAADSLATGPLVGRHRFAGDDSPAPAVGRFSGSDDGRTARGSDL